MELKAERNEAARSDEYARARGGLYDFVRAAWRIVEPHGAFVDNWHIAYLCEWLECITYGEAPCPECCEAMGTAAEPVHAMVVNIPPRYMKSLIVTVMWPVWEWIDRPGMRYLFSSYSANLSTTHSLARRRIVESDWYQGGYGKSFTLTSDQNVKTYYENDRRGHMMATSTGGSATGQGGDRVVIDDPQNPQDAHSEAKRLSANRFFDETLSTRLNDKSTGAFVLIMQRLHQSDLTGHVLDEGGWIHVRVPAIAEVDETVVFPRSGRVVTRKTGELLWEAREDTAQIERVKRRLGSYGFAGQYQQRPTPAEGGMVKREWLRYWTLRRRADDPPDVVELPESLTGHRQSWDMGLWGEARDDYTVGLVGARAGANVYVLDGIRERLGLPGCIAALHTLTARNCRATRKVIEKAANGSEVARRLAGTVPGIIALPPRGSKEARLAAATPMIEAGNVFLPHPREAGWMADCIEELVSFPFAEHDDFTDALSQLVNDFANNAGGASSAGFGGGLDIGGTT